MTVILQILVILERFVVSLSKLISQEQIKNTGNNLDQGIQDAKVAKDTSQLDQFFKGPLQ